MVGKVYPDIMATLHCIYNSYPHGWDTNTTIIHTITLKGDSIEQLYEKLYKRACSESYCYPRSNMRPVCKKKEQKYLQWERNFASDINNYAKYNKMD